MAIPPVATKGTVLKTLVYVIGLTALFVYFASVSFERRSYVSVAIWSIAAIWSGLYVPWINRAAIRAFLSGKMIRLRTDSSGRVIMHCPSCSSDAEVDLTAQTVACPACGTRGTIIS